MYIDLMSKTDTRWIQRLNNYQRALKTLESAVTLAAQRSLSDLEKQGLIQSFEFCHELAWNLMKDYFVFQGNSEITGSRDASREAFKQGLVQDGEAWMNMILSRNKSSHTYNQIVANEIERQILDIYFPLMKNFKDKMIALSQKNP